MLKRIRVEILLDFSLIPDLWLLIFLTLSYLLQVFNSTFTCNRSVSCQSIYSLIIWFLSYNLKILKHDSVLCVSNKWPKDSAGNSPIPIPPWVLLIYTVLMLQELVFSFLSPPPSYFLRHGSHPVPHLTSAELIWSLSWLSLFICSNHGNDLYTEKNKGGKRMEKLQSEKVQQQKLRNEIVTKIIKSTDDIFSHLWKLILWNV